MKILHVINKCTHTSIPVEMASMMSKEDEVSIVAFYDSQEKAESIIKNTAPDCRVYGCDYSRHKFAAIKRLQTILGEGHFDIVHTHHAVSGSIARFLAYGKGKTRLVHTVHADHHSFNWMQNLVIGITLNKCDLITFNSKCTQKGLLGWQKTMAKSVKQKVIYNGIDTKRIISAADDFQKEFCLTNQINDDDFLFAQVGRMEPVKNAYSSLVAFHLFLKEYSGDDVQHLKFIYIGAGRELNKLKTYVNENQILQDHVFFTGMIERDCVYSMLHRINALVVPSYYEGFCNALFEGMAAGVRLCVSDIPVFHELIEENKEIIRFNPKDPQDIAAKLLTCCQIQWTESNSHSWSEKAAENYDVNICIEKYLEQYKEIM